MKTLTMFWINERRGAKTAWKMLGKYWTNVTWEVGNVVFRTKNEDSKRSSWCCLDLEFSLVYAYARSSFGSRSDFHGVDGIRCVA